MEGTKGYEPVVGDGAFHRHVKMHNRKECDSRKSVCVSADKMILIINATAAAVSLDFLTLSFIENKQDMIAFANALIELGQSYSSLAVNNVNHVLPCAKAAH